MRSRHVYTVVVISAACCVLSCTTVSGYDRVNPKDAPCDARLQAILVQQAKRSAEIQAMSAREKKQVDMKRQKEAKRAAYLRKRGKQPENADQTHDFPRGVTWLKEYGDVARAVLEIQQLLSRQAVLCTEKINGEIFHVIVEGIDTTQAGCQEGKSFVGYFYLANKAEYATVLGASKVVPLVKFVPGVD